MGQHPSSLRWIVGDGFFQILIREEGIPKTAFIFCQGLYLHSPALNRSFVVQTDASSCGLEAALLQEFDDVLCSIVYVSHTMMPAECNYCDEARVS